MAATPVRLEIYQTAIPMRSFEHAAARREVAEAVVVRMAFSDGAVGWGETLPRDYVTGETPQSVIRDVSEFLWPALAGRDITGASVPTHRPTVGGASRCINAAACAMDLASLRRLMDEAGRIRTDLLDHALAGLKSRTRIEPRVSCVLGSADPGKAAKRLQLMRLYGLGDFKLKLGFGDQIDAENLRQVHKRIGKALAAGRCTLRVDVNGGWDAASTPQRVAALVPFGVCAVEQPVYCPAGDLVQLARRCELPLMADESLLRPQDAEVLLSEPKRVWWNIRLSKNGGLAASLRLAKLAAEHGVTFTIGCMVGETSILSAAQRLLLQWSPPPRFVEGNYGRFLLADDLVRRSLRFGYGGRLQPVRGGDLGIRIDPKRMGRYGVLVAELGTH
jgi:muconate cycloisomerase